MAAPKKVNVAIQVIYNGYVVLELDEASGRWDQRTGVFFEDIRALTTWLEQNLQPPVE